jgi:D-citramalate synthase
MDPLHVSVMDTTLRDGEQTPNVAYVPSEKLQLAKLLIRDVRVDRIEIASTRVSHGERQAVSLITSWAARADLLDRIEVLGFCDGSKSVEWLVRTGGRVLNLLVKGSERHCREQLRASPVEHRARLAETVRAATAVDCAVNVYLEDWSSGMSNSPSYVFEMLDHLVDLRVGRIYLPDTLGLLSPSRVTEYVRAMVERSPNACLEFHGHNDYGMATANCLAAVAAGVRGIHTSVNGLGERAGNAPLAQTVVAIHDHTHFHTSIDEGRLLDVSRLVQTFSGKAIADNTPVVGQDVFTQTAGVHADGDAKGNLYASRLDPSRFGRQRQYALGKMSGRASLDQNLKMLGIDLNEELRELVLKRVTELGDKKHAVYPDDLPLIIADVARAPPKYLVRVTAYRVTVANYEPPKADVTVYHRGEQHTATATGAGGYDAFMRALVLIAPALGMQLPELVDYRVRIPPGGHTEVLVSWKPLGDPIFSTIGVDSDQLAASVLATEKMMNRILAARVDLKGEPQKSCAGGG